MGHSKCPTLFGYFGQKIQRQKNSQRWSKVSVMDASRSEMHFRGIGRSLPAIIQWLMIFWKKKYLIFITQKCGKMSKIIILRLDFFGQKNWSQHLFQNGLKVCTKSFRCSEMHFRNIGRSISSIIQWLVIFWTEKRFPLLYDFNLSKYSIFDKFSAKNSKTKKFSEWLKSVCNGCLTLWNAF